MLRREKIHHRANARQWLVLVPILIALCFTHALAENVTYTSAIDTLTVSYSGCIAGNDYSIIIVNGVDSQAAFHSGNLLFIDQMTANSNGDVFIAFVSPTFPACSVFLGGQFPGDTASPVKLGTYAPPDSTPEASFVLPGMLMTIEDEAFAGCSFTHVYLGEQVSGIGSRAFANSNSLQYIYLPNATQAIAADAFSGSNNVVIGCHAGSYAEQYAIANGIPYQTVD